MHEALHMCFPPEVPKGFTERRLYLRSVLSTGVLGQHGMLLIMAKLFECGTLPFGVYCSVFFPLIRNEDLPRVVFCLIVIVSQLFVCLGHGTVYSRRTFRSPLDFAGRHLQEGRVVK